MPRTKQENVPGIPVCAALVGVELGLFFRFWSRDGFCSLQKANQGCWVPYPVVEGWALLACWPRCVGVLQSLSLLGVACDIPSKESSPSRKPGACSG